MVKRLLLAAAVLLALLLSSAGCAAGPLRSQEASPDWSRGVQVGEGSLNETVAMYVEPDGQRVHLAWSRIAPEGDSIAYVQIDAAGKVLKESMLPFAVRSPRQVVLLPVDDSGLAICYLSGISEGRRVYAAWLDAEGEPLAEPIAVSGDDLEADDYTAVVSPMGLEVFWSNNRHGVSGLYHVRLDAGGRIVQPSKLVSPLGISPQAQVDGEGRVHLAWIQEPSYFDEHVFYAPFSTEARELVDPVELDRFTLSPKATRFGPVLGLSKDHVHVVWAWEFLGGSSGAGEGECWYASFAPGRAQEATPRLLAVPPVMRPAYEPAEGTPVYTQLAAMGDAARGLVYMPATVLGQPDEAPLAVAFEAATRSGSRILIGMVYMDAQGAKGYQIAAQSSKNVIRPAVAIDRRGELHLAWLELAGFRRYRIFYAGTSEATQAALGHFGRDDLVNGIYAILWALMQGVSMFPLGLVWLAVPFIWVMAYYLIKVEGDLQRRGPRIALGIAVVLYLACKYLLMPTGFLGAAPFIGRMPPVVADAYILGLPLAILGLALGALWLYTRRAESRTLLLGYVVFGLTDAFATFLLYAPGMFGE